MPTIGTSSKPAYVYDAGTDTWIPIGPGEHTHAYVEKSTLTTTGDLVYASAANTPARLGIGSTGQVLTVSGGIPAWSTAGRSAFVGCSLFKSASGQVVASNTAAAVTFDAESFDSDGFHDNTTNNSRVTVPAGQAGKYLIIGRTIWNEYNKGKVASNIRLNGTTTLAYSVDYTATDYWESHQITAIVDLAVGDYIELVVENGGGGNRTIHRDSDATKATQLIVGRL